MKINLVFGIVIQIVILATVSVCLINAAPVQEEHGVKLVRIARHPADYPTTYKYQEAIAAYTHSPFGPKISPTTTTTTTTTPAPVKTTKKPWWKLWR